jgi:leucyl-tRNA---protein transferase
VITDRLKFINEEFFADSVGPVEYDRLLADGWRHFGTHFFRYSLNLHRGDIVRVIPLRIRLGGFRLSRSQRRILARNGDLIVEISPCVITREIEDLFDRHKGRFDHAVPESVYDFLSYEPENYPTRGFQLTARDSGGKLLAASFFDVGEVSVSATYACFDPEETRRSLGIFTMLKVIEYSRTLGKDFYYHGYSYDAPSFYDYKFRFTGLEAFNWEGNWEKDGHREHRDHRV